MSFFSPQSLIRSSLYSSPGAVSEERQLGRLCRFLIVFLLYLKSMFTSKCLRTRYQNVRRGSSGRVQVFHDLTYAQAFTQVRTRVLSHIHTHSRSRINTQSAFAFLSPLGTGFLFSSQLSALSTPLSSVQKQPPSLESETTCFFSSLLLLIFFDHFFFYLF